VPDDQLGDLELLGVVQTLVGHRVTGRSKLADDVADCGFRVCDKEVLRQGRPITVLLAAPWDAAQRRSVRGLSQRGSDGNLRIRGGALWRRQFPIGRSLLSKIKVRDRRRRASLLEETDA